MTAVYYDNGLELHVVRYEGRNVAYFPADQEHEALGYARRLHDGSGQPEGSKVRPHRTPEHVAALIEAYFTDPPYADVLVKGRWLRILFEDGDAFVVRVERI